MTQPLTTQTQITAQPENPKRVLPCRGCTTACKHFDVCEGKPWRLKQHRSE